VSEPSAEAASDTAAPEGADPAASVEELVEARLWRALGDDLALMPEPAPPSRFPYARERILMCRLYLGLIRSIAEDFGAPFAAQGESASVRAVGIYVLFRTMMCLPVHAGDVAHALKLPRATALHGLQQLIKHGYVERVGNAYRVTDKVNLADLGERMQARIEMIADTARKLVDLRDGASDATEVPGEP
jgi:hypothetical protein